MKINTKRWEKREKQEVLMENYNKSDRKEKDCDNKKRQYVKINTVKSTNVK